MQLCVIYFKLNWFEENLKAFPFIFTFYLYWVGNNILLSVVNFSLLTILEFIKNWLINVNHLSSYTHMRSKQSFQTQGHREETNVFFDKNPYTLQ